MSTAPKVCRLGGQWQCTNINLTLDKLNNYIDSSVATTEERKEERRRALLADGLGKSARAKKADTDELMGGPPRRGARDKGVPMCNLYYADFQIMPTSVERSELSWR